MRVETQVAIAFGLDLVLGDPRWLPHPVKGIGRLALALEAPLRRAIRNERVAGIAAVCAVLSAVALCGFALLAAARVLHPAAGDAVAIAVLYTCFAARDLAVHAERVRRALEADDLAEARRRVGMLVGRDTERLDEPGIVRGAVESVAENLVDGVTAPLFFAVAGGPVGALLYKAVNTLDSTFGYKNARYLRFGWAAARLDDFVNWLPARLTAPLVAVAAALLGLRTAGAWRIFRRDGRKHPSPNSGLAEAAVAGALGVQLGGLNHYFGEPSERPRMGDACEPLRSIHIRLTVRLMLCASVLALGLFAGVRFLIA